MTPRRCARCNSRIDTPEPRDTLCDVCRTAPPLRSTQGLASLGESWHPHMTTDGVDYGRQRKALRCCV
jgi:hypothetical protein